MMKNLFAGFLFALSVLVSGGASAQSCNDPSGFLKTLGTFNVGDVLVLGPDCQHTQSSGLAAFGSNYNAKLCCGASGNGVVNDQPALQACINLAQIAHTGCYVPSGQYKLNTALSITSRIGFFGDGVQSIAGLCSFNANCAINITTIAQVANATTLLPANTVNGITVLTNDAVEIHDLQIAYLTLPAAGSGVTGISVSGTGGSFGTCSATHIYQNVIIQADNLVSIQNCNSWWVDHNIFFNFVTRGMLVAGLVGSGGNDWSIENNQFISGPASNNTCFGVTINTPAAVTVINNKFNFIPNTTTCSAVFLNPTVNATSLEPIRITGNSIEGATSGIVFFNSCPSNVTCSASQITISGNQIWTGAGFNGGIPIYIGSTGGAAVWVNDVTISGNVFNVVGGGSNNFNIILSANNIQNTLIEANIFGNTSAAGSTSIFNGAGNLNIKSTGNHALASDAQSLGTANTAPFTLACSTLATNTLYNAVEVFLSGATGTGVTAILKNGNTVLTQASAALGGPLSFILNVGETMQVNCATIPTATYAAFNP